MVIVSKWSSPQHTYPLIVRVVGAPRMISKPVSYIFLCSLLPSATWQTQGPCKWSQMPEGFQPYFYKWFPYFPRNFSILVTEHKCQDTLTLSFCRKPMPNLLSVVRKRGLLRTVDKMMMSRSCPWNSSTLPTLRLSKPFFFSSPWIFCT